MSVCMGLKPNSVKKDLGIPKQACLGCQMRGREEWIITGENLIKDSYSCQVQAAADAFGTAGVKRAAYGEGGKEAITLKGILCERNYKQLKVECKIASVDF